MSHKSFFLESIILFLIIITFFCIFFSEAVFLGKTLLPADITFFYSPWREYFPNLFKSASNWILFDELFEFAPWREWTKHQLLKGIIPLWDSHSFCGYPFLAIWQSAVFYPFDLILLSTSMASYPLWRSLFHILIAAFGMYWFLRKYPLKVGSSLLGAVLYSFSGFMIVWLGHPHFKVAAWLPWLFLSVRTLNRKPSLKPALGLVFVISMQFFAGHVETSLHVLTATFIYAIILLFNKNKHKNRFAGWVILAFLLALMLIAVNFLPFAEYLQNSSAYAARKSGVWVKPNFPLSLFSSLWEPKFFGSNADNNYFFPQFNSSEIMGGFVGILPFILALYSLLMIRKNREVMRLWLLLFFSIAIVFKIPPIFQLLHLIPVFKMSYNFRFLLITAFTISALAAMTLEKLQHSKFNYKYFVLFWLFPAAISIFMHIYYHSLIIKHLIPSYTLYQGLLSLFFWVSIPMILYIFRWNRIPERMRWMILILFCFSNLWLIERNYNHPFNPILLTPQTKLLENLPKKKGEYRILPLGYTYPPHLSILYDFQDIRGNDALTPLTEEQYLSLVAPEIYAPGLLPALRLLTMKHFNHWLIDLLNVRYIITPQHTSLDKWVKNKKRFQAQNYRLLNSKHGVSIYENLKSFPRTFLTDNIINFQSEKDAFLFLSKADAKPQPIFTIVCHKCKKLLKKDKTLIGNAKIVNYSSNKIIIKSKANKPSILVLSDTYFPGWQAFVNGQPHKIYQINHTLRGIILPSGTHQIKFIYRPFSFKLGLFISLLATMFFTILVVNQLTANQFHD